MRNTDPRNHDPGAGDRLSPAATSFPTRTRATSRLSQAAVADQTGAEALFLNTAALAGPGRARCRGVPARSSSTGRLVGSEPGQGVVIPQDNTPPAAAVAYGSKLENGMAWGAGSASASRAAASLVWPNGWQGQEYIQTVKQQVFAIGAGVAFQPLPFLKIGASYVRAIRRPRSCTSRSTTSTTSATAASAMSGGANGFGLAAEVHVPTIPLSFGVTYSHSANFRSLATCTSPRVPPAFETMLHDQTVTEQLIIPNVLFVGAAYEVDTEPQGDGGSQLRALDSLQERQVRRR